MSYLETIEQARTFLERDGRVSFRALQREFDLADSASLRVFKPGGWHVLRP